MIVRSVLLALISVAVFASSAVAVEESTEVLEQAPGVETTAEDQPVFGPKVDPNELQQQFDQKGPKGLTPPKSISDETPASVPSVTKPPQPEPAISDAPVVITDPESVEITITPAPNAPQAEPEIEESAPAETRTPAITAEQPSPPSEPVIEAAPESTPYQGRSIFGYRLPYPNFHPWIVHFPVALLLLAPIFMLVGLLVFSEGVQDTAVALTVMGFCFALLAAEVVHPVTVGLSEAAQLALTRHDRYAHFTVLFSGAAVLFGGLRWLIRPLRRSFAILAFCALLLAALCVGMTAHFGMELVYGHGVGVQGQFLQPSQ